MMKNHGVKAHAYDRNIGYDEEFVRTQNSKRIRRSNCYYNDALTNEWNRTAYHRVIMCPYPSRFVVTRSVRECSFPIRTIVQARQLAGVGKLMACVLLGICEDGCKICGCHAAYWSRCILH